MRYERLRAEADRLRRDHPPPGPCTGGLALSFDGAPPAPDVIDCSLCGGRHPPFYRIDFETVPSPGRTGPHQETGDARRS